MAAVTQVTQGGPKSFIPAEVILGGQLVEARTGGRIGVAAADSVKVLGVALTDGQSPETAQGGTTVDAIGRPIINAMPIPTVVSVAYAGTETKVTYSAAATFGDKLVSTGSGKVGPAPVDATAAEIVGICTQPQGVAANAVGLIRIA
ncbi:hypothetical protein ACLBYD_30330 [Rhodococcus sp. C26F]|uniref:hypothetical protein n=1 Tax=unclassified Rhodococcus (in: high G+C Gram-positive bacteria) TaxID=192944 RepID=UPI001C598094|nr:MULTISPECIES: hypothetical protein [unclassified Rhodococcus (in: high G+C Gram-positive bacteria)]QXU53620.1 hypothetical protein KXC42_23330 [Rhodococcus sp. LW-XY12]BDB62364.1 hypothetical protein RDE2_41580 [Rhodococcus sp. RDE2]